VSEPRSVGDLLAHLRERFIPVPDQPPAHDRRSALPGPSRERRDEQVEHPTIPRCFRWAALDAPELRRRVARIEAIAEGEAALFSPGLLLVGPSASGKTSLACALLRAWEVRSPRRRGMFASARSLGVARAHNGFGRGEAAEVERAMSASLLLLDDLGGQRDMPSNAVPRDSGQDPAPLEEHLHHCRTASRGGADAQSRASCSRWSSEEAFSPRVEGHADQETRRKRGRTGSSSV
jgi:hypothetical protein